MRLTLRVARIGRADDNDIVVPDLRVSRHHAELRRSAGGDCGVADLAGDQLQKFDDAGDISLEARLLTVTLWFRGLW